MRLGVRVRGSSAARSTRSTRVGGTDGGSIPQPTLTSTRAPTASGRASDTIAIAANVASTSTSIGGRVGDKGDKPMAPAGTIAPGVTVESDSKERPQERSRQKKW